MTDKKDEIPPEPEPPRARAIKENGEPIEKK
jgi:hypothetical protein